MQARGGQSHQAAGQGRIEAGATQSMQYFFSPSSLKVSQGVFLTSTHEYKTLTPLCILIDSLRNLLRPAMAIDGHRARPTVDNVYRWICTSYAAGSDHRWTRFPKYCGGQCLPIVSIPRMATIYLVLLPSFRCYCRRQYGYLSIDTFRNQL